MPINVWRRSAAAARAALRRSASTSSAPTAQRPLRIYALAAATSARGIPVRFGRVERRQLSSTSDAPSIWQLAEQLRSVDVKGDREPVVSAIQSVVIRPGSTDEREAQALDIIQSNVLESLLGLLADERLTDFHVPTYLALIKLSAEPLISQELLRLNAPRTVATYCGHADPRLQAAACLTLGNLALEPTSELAMASVEVIDPLFGVLASPHEAIKRAAVTTIATIAGSPRGRQQLCEMDRIMTLCALLSSDYSDSLRSAVAFALGNILSDHDASAQDALRDSGALPDLILLVSPAFPDDVCSSAAWAIHHGVHQNHASQSMVAEAGGLGLLFQHVFADDETLQTNALLALESTITGHSGNTESCRNNVDAVQLLEVLREQAADEGDLSPTATRALDALLQQVR